MSWPPRVAFFPDCFVEVNGVARTSTALDACARRRGIPLLTVHAGPALREVWADQGGILQLPRSRLALQLEPDLHYDLLFWRHARRVRRALTRFRPDVVHVTGPNDVGQLGAWLAWRLRIPLVASWHTNLHEFAARRAARRLSWLPAALRDAIVAQIERRVLGLTARFYAIPRVLMAPTPELVAMVERLTAKPARLMRRGIETDIFSPERRNVTDNVFRLGYVGRLSPEKDVRMLAEIERALIERGATAYRFLIVGDGSERPWLERHMRSADLTGVLRGAELARAYANMDVFVFPSATDTFDMVVLEALASGTPAIVRPRGGPSSIIEDGASGFVADTPAAFADAVLRLMRDPIRHRSMREAARTRAMPWSWERTFDAVYGAYGEALGASDVAF